MENKTKQKVLQAIQRFKDGQREDGLKKIRLIRSKVKNDLLLEAAYAEMLQHTQEYDELISLLTNLIDKHDANLTVFGALFDAYIQVKEYNKAEVLLEKIKEKFEPSVRVSKLSQQLSYAKKDYKNSLKFALEVVRMDPTSSMAYNNVGLSLSEMGLHDQSGVAFETAVQLDSENIDAIQNMAFIAYNMGDVDKSIQLNERSLELLEKKGKRGSLNRIKWHLSFGYLFKGDLAKGWEYYDEGFSPDIPEGTRRGPSRDFSVPRWSGEDLKNKTILVWREQGLGDELRYGSCLPDLVSMAGKVIVECDHRLCKVLQDSMPEILARPPLFDKITKKSFYKLDYDFHIPIASLPRYFRSTRESFLSVTDYIKPEPKLTKEIKDHFDVKMKSGLKIGISWRSGVMDPTRNKFYLNLVEWSEILQLKNCHFVNLQYGDVEPEITAAENALGVKIHRWPDLNLKDDLEAAFALMANMDLVISVGNAVASMAPLVGTETWQLIPSVHWVELKGLDLPHYPWSKNLINFHPEPGYRIESIMPVIRDRIISKL